MEEFSVIIPDRHQLQGVIDFMAPPNSSVFGRTPAEIAAAVGHGQLVAVLDGNGRTVGSGGVFDRAEDWFDIGGMRVERNGFKLQSLMTQVLALSVFVSQEEVRAVTSCCFADNMASRRNIEHAHFEERHTPDEIQADRMRKAGGKPAKIYEATDRTKVLAARDLVALIDEPIRRGSAQAGDVRLELNHPLFTLWRPFLRLLANQAVPAARKQRTPR